MLLNKNNIKHILFLLASSTFSAQSIADNSVNTPGDDLFFKSDVPIVLSATRLEQPQTESPSTITIIDQRLINASGAKSIPELFRLVPGMHIGYFRGNKPVVGYQGLSGEYPQGVQVLVDGRSVYSPLFGGVDWSNLPLEIEDIERIEVIRGQNGSSFGSNAFQAVINITTTHAVQLDAVEIKNTVGERGYQRTLLRAGKSFGDIDIRMTVSHLDDNGYRANDDDLRTDSLTGRLDYQISATDSLQLNIGITNLLKETRNPSTLPDPFDPLRYIDESSQSVHAKWEHHIGINGQIITQASYTRHISKDKISSFFTTPIPQFSNVLTNIDGTNYYDRYDFEFEHQFQPLDPIRVSWGLGSRNDRVMQPYWMGTKQKRDNSIQRVFGNAEWKATEQFIINVGALWEHSQLSGDNVSPRLAINYLMTPQHSLRLSASRAYRAPVLAEKNFNADITLQSQDVVGLSITQPLLRSSNNIEPEEVNSFEMGYHGLFIDNTLTLDIKLFRNEYKKLINAIGEDTDAVITLFGIPQTTIDLGNEVNTFDNLYKANINGYEVELNYRPDINNLLHIGYSYSHTNVGKLSNKTIENIQSSLPKDTFNLLASHTFSQQITASAAFYYTGSMEYLVSGNPQGPMRRLDLNVAKKINLPNKQQLDIQLTLQLALDKNKDFLSQFHLDNRAFIEASYSFN